MPKLGFSLADVNLLVISQKHRIFTSTFVLSDSSTKIS